jgi:MarR family transcriptional regulator, negative regulator of the multidrug operon emrRAB
MSDPRATNLVGSGSLAVADNIRTAVHAATGLDASAAAALNALSVFAEGEGVDTLARALSLSHSGAVRLVDQLAARGLVRRSRNTRDRRAVAIELTPKGRREAAGIAEARKDAVEEVLVPLTEKERERLGDLLGKLVAGQTHGVEDARRICRLCDADACGHPDRCPVTQAAHG